MGGDDRHAVLVAVVEDRLHTRFSPAECERTIYRAHLADPARQVARLVRNEIGRDFIRSK